MHPLKDEEHYRYQIRVNIQNTNERMKKITFQNYIYQSHESNGHYIYLKYQVSVLSKELYMD